MAIDEIEIPKELRPIMLEKAEETFLGQKNGANKQYRYCNLHIREYRDKYLVHMDKFDPRKNPIGHLIFDAPEVLIGLACAAFGGVKMATYLSQKQRNDSKKAKQNSTISGLITSLIAGYLGYRFTKLVKNS